MRKSKVMPKIGAMAMAIAIAATATMPAFADGQVYSATTDGANVVIFEKYLTMDKEANVPNVEFAYTLTPGAAQNANVTNATMQVYAGNDANRVVGFPVMAAGNDGKAVFQTGGTTYDTIQASSDSLNSQHASQMDNLTLQANEKYAKDNVKIDFTHVQFKEPGIYRYIVTENATSGYHAGHGITDDTDNTRILDVYVIDDGVDTANANKPKLKIQGYVLHNTEADAVIKADGTSQQATKADGFWNKYETENLTLSKTVTGNQGSRDEYFEFTVKISDANPGTKYDVTGNFDQTTAINAINTTAHTNPTSITVPSGASEVTQVFWLQHGQNITINGLAKNSQYDVNENVTTLGNEGYTPAAAITGDTKTGATDEDNVVMDAATTKVQDTAIKADTTVAYTNDKAGVIPTGVIMTVAPFAAVTLLGGAGAVGMMMKKKREDDDEE